MSPRPAASPSLSPTDGPAALLAAWPADRPLAMLAWHGGGSDGPGRTFAATPVHRTELRGPNALSELRTILSSAKTHSTTTSEEPPEGDLLNGPSGKGFFVMLGYDLFRQLESTAVASPGAIDDRSWPDAILLRCEGGLLATDGAMRIRGDAAFVPRLSPRRIPRPSIGSITTDRSAAQYQAMVAEVVERIRRGDCFQANVAQRFGARFRGSVRAVATAAREFAELSTALSAMTSGLRERYEMRNAMEIAMEVQQNLLPSNAPSSHSLDIAAANVYSDETGGDYYDFPDQGTLFDTEAGSTLAVIGDVTGHGIGAALIMATARAAIRTRLRHATGLGPLLDDVNAVLVEDVPAGRFMTLLLLLIAPDGSGFRWASAGHDPPIIYDPVEDRFVEPEGGNVPLGIVEDERFEELQTSLHGPGSIVLAATDGVWETVDPDGDFFGKDRLREVIRANRDRTADEITKAVVEAADLFRGHDRPADDVTIVVVKTI